MTSWDQQTVFSRAKNPTNHTQSMRMKRRSMWALHWAMRRSKLTNYPGAIALFTAHDLYFGATAWLSSQDVFNSAPRAQYRAAQYVVRASSQADLTR